VGIAGLAGLILWRFPKVLPGLLSAGRISSTPFTVIFANYESLAVAGGILLLGWLFTRDTFFARHL
jgi:hypothetical protein